jgi:hypothetical protein
MKHLFYFILLITFCGCSKTDETVLTDEITIDATHVLKAQGSFVTSAHPASGTAQLILGPSNLYVQLKNFKTENGPDLYVYLSKDNQAKDYKELGKLKSVNGNFYYTADPKIDIAAYNKVLIWCKSFSVLFAVAEVK